MTEEEIKAALAERSPRTQVAFLVGCVEHVSLACWDDDGIVARAIELAWSFVEGGAVDAVALESLRTDLDDAVDEDSATELVHLAAAAELVATSTEAPSLVAGQVLNNLEAVIDVVDPEAERGIVEEQTWQERALAIARGADDSVLARDLFTSICRHPPDWLGRAR